MSYVVQNIKVKFLIIFSSILIMGPIIVAPNQSELINYITFITANPQSDFYTSNDGEKFQPMKYDDKSLSRSFYTVNEKYDGIFYDAITTVKSNLYIMPVKLAKVSSCITAFDYIDPNNSGHKKWVFRCDLKSNQVHSPFQELLDHIHELGKEATTVSHHTMLTLDPYLEKLNHKSPDKN